MERRQTNLEMMRVLLMCTIPVYHLMVYNGVLYLDNTNAILALVLSVGGAIPADYAFMAMSAYFFLETKERPVIRRFLLLGAQVLTLYIIKAVTLRSLFGYHNTEYFIDFFLMKGAWWYIYPYLLLSLCYPLLNRAVYGLKKRGLYLLTAALFLVLLWYGISNRNHFAGDLAAFLFTYFFMGCLKRDGYQKLLGIRISRKNMAILALFGYALLLLTALAVKMPVFGIQTKVVRKVLQHLIGRYQIVAVFMGYAVFFLFREIPMAYHRIVHTLSGWTMYVFLLHDTWMGVFWYFGVCGNDLGRETPPAFVFWTLCYPLTAFLAAGVVKKAYDMCLAPLWSRAVQKICSWPPVRRWEERLCRM